MKSHELMDLIFDIVFSVASILLLNYFFSTYIEMIYNFIMTH